METAIRTLWSYLPLSFLCDMLLFLSYADTVKSHKFRELHVSPCESFETFWYSAFSILCQKHLISFTEQCCDLAVNIWYLHHVLEKEQLAVPNLNWPSLAPVPLICTFVWTIVCQTKLNSKKDLVDKSDCQCWPSGKLKKEGPPPRSSHKQAFQHLSAVCILQQPPLTNSPEASRRKPRTLNAA